MEGQAATAPVRNERPGRMARWSDSEVIVAEPGSARRNWSDPLRHRGRPAREEAPRKAREDDELEGEESEEEEEAGKDAGQDEAEPADAEEDTPLQFPPHLLLLGTVAFFLYLALYLVDLAVLHLTFVPGGDLPWLALKARRGVMSGARQALTDSDARRLIWGLAQIPWRLFVGTHYRPGAALRTVDALLMWSFGLDIAALCVAVLLVYWMWCHDRPEGWKSFRAPNPLGLLPFLVVAALVLDPTKDAHMVSSIAVGTIILTIWWLIEQALAGFMWTSLASHVPASFYWQICLSFYRLRSLDPYEHQIHAWEGLIQLCLLGNMLGTAKQAMGHLHQCIVDYVDRVVEARHQADDGEE